MDTRGRKVHWDTVYGSKSETEVSWFQETAATSLDLLSYDGISEKSAIVDVGGGASRLVDALLDRGYADLTVLDLSAAALAAAKARLGDRASKVRWIVADITQWSPPVRFDLWHDRAVLHFLTAPADRSAYLNVLRQASRPGGLVIIATFDLDGPDKCSGLPVQRYSPASLSAFLGADFEPVDHRAEMHATPWGSGQAFQFSRFVRRS